MEEAENAVDGGNGAHPAREDEAAAGRAGDGGGRRRGRRRGGREDDGGLPWYIDVPLVILMTLLIIFVVQTFLGRVYVIPSSSMEPTLHGCAGCTGDRIVVEKVSYYFSDPQAGDVVVFKGPDSWEDGFADQRRSDNPLLRGLQGLGAAVGLVAPDENDLVKRIVATGGQTVSCQEGDPAVMVDGHPTDQSFTLRPPQVPTPPEYGSEACGGAYFGPVTVPPDHVFVMGDNRTNSADSRYHLGDPRQGTIPEENIRGKVVLRIFPLDRIGTVPSAELAG